MDEELMLLLEEAKEKFDKALKHLKNELKHIRAGKADVHLLDDIVVDYYGNKTPLNQVSNINTPDARTISIQPWEKSLIPVIEKAIMEANLGLNPENNGEVIRIFIPPLSEERRKELVKRVKKEGEQTKIGIRNVRREILEELKKLKKEGLSEDIEKRKEEELENTVKEYIKKIDEMLEKKEEDIMKF